MSNTLRQKAVVKQFTKFTAGAKIVKITTNSGRVEMNYYESKDLAKFAEVGKFAPSLMDKFFAYYTAATGTDGALTRKEKSLIALAIAHAKQCPYCIDAYTTQCLESGANPEQMTEAIHVAAAMEAGMALVHGVQMQNALKQKGAM